MSATVGFGDVGGYLFLESVRNDIAARYRERQFELSVGDSDVDLRLAMNFRREAARIASEGGRDRTIWLRLLGSQPLRAVVEGALGLPSSFGSIDLDQQLEELAARGEPLLGTAGPSALTDPATLDTFVERFLLNSQIANGAVSATTRGTVALTLLGNSALGPGASAGLFASNFS